MNEFPKFPKIPRLSAPVVITEKIDGTHGVVAISLDGTVRAGSRNRWLTPEDDNAGFAAWVYDNADQLCVALGPGVHHGEWWGAGIQRRYDMTEKWFSLFNVKRWTIEGSPGIDWVGLNMGVVPLLGVRENGRAVSSIVTEYILHLSEHGSQAALGFMRPEGIVVNLGRGHLFKAFLENDQVMKSAHIL